jgi:hypothetical protein
MIITTILDRDDNGVIVNPKSEEYNPEEKVRQVTNLMTHDFERSNQAKTKSYPEFNNLTLMQRQAVDQLRFNGYQIMAAETPDEEWRSNAVRPITRNRAISIAAHITGSIMYPQINAQNQNDDEDKASATVMRDLMEWSNEQATYDRTFVYAAIAALVNPAVIIHSEYTEVYRDVKREKLEGGGYRREKILDEIYSGFQDTIVPLDEFWHPDFYEHNIQKQDHLIRRRTLTFSAAKAKHGEAANWKYVKPGLHLILPEGESAFYEAYDDNLRGELVEEIIYWNRAEDLMLVFCNGVLVTDPENPNPREDKKYPFSKTGFELIDEGKFFYYKSMVFKLGPDEEVVQTLYRMIIDGTFLQLMPPTLGYGEEAVESSSVAPGAVTTLREGSKFEKVDVGSNLQAGMAALDKVEGSMSESSQDPQQAGQAPSKEMTAFEVDRLEQNAKVLLGLFGKMIGFLVDDFGGLRVGDILQYLTIGDVQEVLAGGGQQFQLRSFLIPNRTVNGKSKTRKIQFDMDMPDQPLSEEKMMDESFKLLDKEGGPDSDREIYRVNPQIFRTIKFKIRVTPDIITPPIDNLARALNLELYDRAIANQHADQEALYRELLLGSYDRTKNDTDKYVNKDLEQPGGDLAALIGANPASGQPDAAGQTRLRANQRSQQTQSATMGKSMNV